MDPSAGLDQRSRTQDQKNTNNQTLFHISVTYQKQDPLLLMIWQKLKYEDQLLHIHFDMNEKQTNYNSNKQFRRKQNN